jgi:hypothetical protein
VKIGDSHVTVPDFLVLATYDSAAWNIARV